MTMWEEATVSYMYLDGELEGSYSAMHRYPFSEMDKKEALQVLSSAAKQHGVCITLYTRFYSSMRDSCPPWIGKTPLGADITYKRLCAQERGDPTGDAQI